MRHRIARTVFAVLDGGWLVDRPVMEVESRRKAPRRGVPVGGRLRGEDGEAEVEAGVRRGAGAEPVLIHGSLPAQPHETAQPVGPSHVAIDGIVPGERITAYGAGEVVASACAEYKEGDVIAGLLGWEDYTLFRPAPGVVMSKLAAGSDDDELHLKHHFSALGTSGMTAYGGFYEVCKPQRGEKVFVSAASGSVGSLVGQFAKLAGCYVVGCAGSNFKVDLLKTQLGFDNAFNYKEEPDMESALKRYFPDGIDIYFDNIGGKTLEAVLACMNTHGRVALCGAISEYTDAGRRATPDLLEVIYKRIAIRGFICTDFLTRFSEFAGIIGDWIRQGKIQPIVDVSNGLESVPSALTELFLGLNIGKKLVKLA
ncbi:hypothetical protein GUJ93_ZPchr0012g19815 [Zizania palustris]|uniref:Enoyl reductase (ER) domain-containing protein n=1 Tax=Zizania palustris TaxID=103762 RepID=A0A8J5WP71_ZIZPA|nr:hypothetical protein GUJ93_ZPchr0012g19815 [Zizania palustris]